MKKYITAAALLAAGTAFVNAESVLLPSFSSAEDFENLWLGSSVTQQASISATAMTTAITEHLDLLNSGWYFSAGQANKTDTYNDITGVTANSGFTFISRKGYGGEYVAATVVLSDLLNDAQTLTELSVTFDYSASANPGLGFSIWSWDGEAVAMILNQTNVAVGENLTFTGTGLSLDSGDVLLVVWNDNGAYATNTISNLRSSVEIIPEPSAFGLLAGLGALALVGSRRRRK